MAQTTYSTLTVDFASDYEGESDGRKNMRKMTSVAAVLFSVVVMFFAGRVYEGQTTPYTHEEVLDISAKCGTGEFIGGCVQCKECAVYEFHNGGCSFFKDSFCSYCEPIRHCNRENIQCETREDQICLECNCYDAAANWTDVELDQFNLYEMFDRPEYAGVSEDAATMACYWNDDCRPCTVCALGYWEVARCTQSTDSMCTKCTDCTEDQWVSSKCIYDKDTECSDCTHCLGAIIDGTYTKQLCYRFESTGPLYDGADAICEDCQECNWDADGNPTIEGNEWYSSDCTEWSNSECTLCTMCDATRTLFSEGGEFIKDYCIWGDIATFGADTICQDCTDHMEGYYESERCEPTGTTDAVWTICTVCRIEQWEHTPCQLSTDSICPPCYPINHCEHEDTVCSNGRSEEDNDSVCVGRGADETMPPHFSCQEDFYGDDCRYWRTYADCGVGPGYRERTVKTGKFRGQSNNEFIAWCMMLCDEFPDCVAFEINDGQGQGPLDLTKPGTIAEEKDVTQKQSLTKPNSLCSLKHIPTGSVTNFATYDVEWDCFSNVRRQREDDLRILLEASGHPFKIDNLDLVFDGVGALPIKEGDWRTDVIGTPIDMHTRAATGESESQLERAMAREAAEGGNVDHRGNGLEVLDEGAVDLEAIDQTQL